LDTISEAANRSVEPLLSTYVDIRNCIGKYYGSNGIPAVASPKLGQIFWLLNKVERDELEDALSKQSQNGASIGEVCLKEGLFEELDLIEALAWQQNMPHVRLKGCHLDSEMAAYIPKDIAAEHKVIPLWIVEDILFVGTVSPEKQAEILPLIQRRGYATQLVICQPKEWEAAFQEIYASRPTSLKAHPNQNGIRTGPHLGELLVAMGLISNAQLDEALQAGAAQGRRLGERLINMGYLDDVDLAEAISLQTGIPYIRLEQVKFSTKLIQAIPPEFACQHQMLPIIANGGDVWVAVSDPLDGRGLREIEKHLNMRVWPLIVPRHQLARTINYYLETPLKVRDIKPLALLDGLVNRGVLESQSSSEILRQYQSGSLAFDEAIMMGGLNTGQHSMDALAAELGVPLLDLSVREETISSFDPLGRPIEQKILRDPVDANVARLLSLETAIRLQALPIKRIQGGIQVAFADPLFERSREEIEISLGIPIFPALAKRSEIQNAIQRVLGRPNIGTYLLRAGYITRHQLNDALDLAKRTGVRIGKALLSRRYVSQSQLYHFLAEQSNLPYYALDAQSVDVELASKVDADVAREHGILPAKSEYGETIFAVVNPSDGEDLIHAAKNTGRNVRAVLVSERDFDNALHTVYKEKYVHKSTSELLTRFPQDSAVQVLSKWQKVALAIFIILTIIWLLIDYRGCFVFWNTLLSSYYVILFVHLIYQVLTRSPEIPVSDNDVDALNDRDLPVYTILVPVYKEAEVLPDLLEAINFLDYPPTKLDIKVLMEADDLDTIDVFEKLNMPDHFQGIIVPAGSPKTKPKACNYGLINAQGEYVVIFDAEDLPDPDQLKRVLVAFDKSGPETVCIQAKLNFYNRTQNLLTRWFTLEYTLWFDFFLPTLFIGKYPMPLGGTSNHFRREALVEVGAWDPHNVTEDADLGLRLFKRGYRSGFVNSTTYEEANSEVYNWIRQRSRWVKGYIQTWLVHMRDPVRLFRELGLKNFISFQIVYGGAFFAPLVNPIYWTLTTLWFITRWEVIPTLFPGFVYYLASISLYFGNFAFTYVNAIAGFRRNQHDLVRYSLLTPLYFGLISIAAWKGLLQLIRKPHFWEKTAHGLFQRDEGGEI